MGRLFGWILVLSTFATLIGLSVAIILKSPPCLDYWEKSPIYQIYPRSFKVSYKKLKVFLGTTISDILFFQDCSNNYREKIGLGRLEICDDGIGDIPGILEKLDYLESDLGIKIIWLSWGFKIFKHDLNLWNIKLLNLIRSPVFQSPMQDFGYDVSDFRAIDPVFGTMADFETLIEKMHDRRIKLVMDYVPNHTSFGSKFCF